MADRHPAADLNEVVHQRARLGILAIVSESGRADFSYLKSSLELTDGNLGRHLEVLEREGYVTLTKEFVGKRPRTWVGITKSGREALSAQIAALQEIIARFE